MLRLRLYIGACVCVFFFLRCFRYLSPSGDVALLRRNSKNCNLVKLCVTCSCHSEPVWLQWNTKGVFLRIYWPFFSAPKFWKKYSKSSDTDNKIDLAHKTSLIDSLAKRNDPVLNSNTNHSYGFRRIDTSQVICATFIIHLWCFSIIF